MVLQEVGCFQEPVHIHTSHSIFSWSQQLDTLRLRLTFFQKAIGNTPLINLNTLSAETSCTVLGKSEFQNPGGSVKDRAALYVVKDAEERGLLKPCGDRCRRHRWQHRHRTLARLPESRLQAHHLHAKHAVTSQDRPVEITGRGSLPRSRRSVGGQPELQLAGEETCGATVKAGLLKDPRHLSISSPSLYPDSSPRLSHV